MRKNKHDIMAFVIILLLLFTVGFHIGRGKDAQIQETRYLTVTVSKSKGIPQRGESLMIDGRFAVQVLETDEGSITFLCRGSMCEAGFLIGGTKYIAKNQPLKVYSDTVYIEGRISELKIA